MVLILHLIKYSTYKYIICGDLKLIGLLIWFALIGLRRGLPQRNNASCVFGTAEMINNKISIWKDYH